jgi:hypothetical protein
VGEVGENGILPNVAYVVQNGILVPSEPDKITADKTG